MYFRIFFFFLRQILALLPMLECRGGTGAQTVTQPDGHVTVTERASLELKCNYTVSYTPTLWWYVQYPNQGLQLLLKYTSGNSLVTGIKSFKAEFSKSESSFHLKKASAHLSDSAQYFCAVNDTVPGAAGGAEHKPPDTLGLPVTQKLSVEVYFIILKNRFNFLMFTHVCHIFFIYLFLMYL
uniref:Immunoglobulin domain-containing protein n=1 Tax=Prolemur simus TaxID=1328070 RepID=A0A8C8ZER1_PROSS